MVRALNEGWIAHAALDVLDKEPPDPSNALFNMENVTLTPHVASASSRVFEVSRRPRGNGDRVGAGWSVANVLR